MVFVCFLVIFHQNYYHFHHRNHHFHYQNQFELDSEVRAIKNVVFGGQKKDHLACLGEGGGGGAGFNGQCPFK